MTRFSNHKLNKMVHCFRCGEYKIAYLDCRDCMDCRKKKSREYYANNREKCKARIAAYDKKHRPDKNKKPKISKKPKIEYVPDIKQSTIKLTRAALRLVAESENSRLSKPLQSPENYQARRKTSGRSH